MSSLLNKYVLFWMLALTAFPACSQGDDGPINDSVIGFVDTAAIRKYKFLRFGLNRIVFPNRESRNFELFYSKFDSLANYNGKDVNVYHIGGSHIQADIYTNEFRKLIQDFGPGLKGSRGWIFPYSMVGTNNPSHYKCESIGEWKMVINTMRKDTTTLGLMGIAGITHDSISNIKIYFRKEEQRYFSNKVRVYHNIENKAYKVEWENPSQVASYRLDEKGGYTEFILKNPSDTASIRIVKIANDTGQFRFFGMQLLINEPGFIYNTIGINGAGFTSYDRCQLFSQQLSQSKPDMFIISIGTNEANTDDFRPDDFEAKYTKMVEKVLAVNPKAALLFTVPNDAYYYKKYPNKNVPVLRDVIFKLAKKYDAGVWDFFAVMGGFNSSMAWYKEQLMHKDRVHFTFEGYNLKGDLFFEAFLKYLDEYEFNRLVKSTNH